MSVKGIIMFLGINNTRLEIKILIILDFENRFLPTYLPLCVLPCRTWSRTQIQNILKNGNILMCIAISKFLPASLWSSHTSRFLFFFILQMSKWSVIFVHFGHFLLLFSRLVLVIPIDGDLNTQTWLAEIFYGMGCERVAQ